MIPSMTAKIPMTTAIVARLSLGLNRTMTPAITPRTPSRTVSHQSDVAGPDLLAGNVFGCTHESFSPLAGNGVPFELSKIIQTPGGR